ncbi:Zn-dependent exopeptidase [Mollisia scopiformis]|uniref:Zn-dependent exopeptidase n=1 Tax=Mollisia scopiformis TaxID=149040 RepID=A0A194WXR9_MOLSC|nr:Zn-dependent exopeptidase [Mollisia scopiformis]KUJ12392.1 Zn-dependent exopeptidase [Mollisia scopiformis]
MRIPLETLQDAEAFMLKLPEADRIRRCSKLYSAEPHLSGDLAHAERIRDLWISYGISSKLVRYDVLQNTPTCSSLSLYSEDGNVTFVAGLEEPVIPEDPTSSPSNGFRPFHGFSANGKVCAELVYANFGTIEDFRLLAAKGISVKDKIVICKYSKIFRGLKVRAAEKYGAAGVIIYSDPQEDGEWTQKNGHLPYPDGPARHPYSVQRGSVDYFSIAVGDPTTPGYPSLPGKGTERKDPGGAIPKIPSLPISYADALPFLKALNGLGWSPDEIGGSDGDWKGELDGVDYFTGPSKVEVTLESYGHYEYTPIYNVIGTIEGTSDELIVMGNHHDSWSCGAVDPVSGSAAMNELVRGLGRLVEMGWKNERTMPVSFILASWDDEEYGLLGSTEWVEENAKMLSKHCVAYLNVDGATNGGSIFGGTGSPLLGSILRSVATLIPSPTSSNKTAYDDWLASYQLSNPDAKVPHLELMGTGSDYTAFFDHLGIPSMDFRFSGKSSSVFHYHSNYDSFYWMEKFGDPDFKKHTMISQAWGVLAVRLANSKILPFEAAEYASTLEKYASRLSAQDKLKLDTKPLEESISRFKSAAKKLDDLNASVSARLNDDDGPVFELSKDIAKINQKLRSIEPGFIIDEGLPGRKWFKHIVFAPGLWLGYGGVVFPGILEALDSGDEKEAHRWVSKIAAAVDAVTNSL